MSEMPKRRWFQFGTASLFIGIAVLAAILAVNSKFKALRNERDILMLRVKELELEGRYENARAEAWRDEAFQTRDSFGSQRPFNTDKLSPRLENPAFNREWP
jgi:hypothetical protein